MLVNWSTFFSFCLTVILIFLIIWLALRPTPIKHFLGSLEKQIKHNPDPQSTQVTDRYTIYRPSQVNDQRHKRSIPVTNSRPITTTATEQPPNNRPLIVVFIGGALVTCEPRNIYGFCNDLFRELDGQFEIVVFRYPVRFRYSLHEIMSHINDTLRNFVHYNHVHAIGISIGALLAGAFHNKEVDRKVADEMKLPQIGMRFESFIGVCGVYECRFDASLINRLFRFYILRNTPGMEHYTCFRMTTIPVLIISSTSDFLLEQTRRFIAAAGVYQRQNYQGTVAKTPPPVLPDSNGNYDGGDETNTTSQYQPQLYYHIFVSPNLPHNFIHFPNLPATKTTLQKVKSFLTQQVQKTNTSRLRSAIYRYNHTNRSKR